MKKVNFGGKRPSASGNGNPDDWVFDRDPAPEQRETTKRLTIDVPLGLHRRIKSQCALEELVMADVIRELLERRFPTTSTATPTPAPTQEIAS